MRKHLDSVWLTRIRVLRLPPMARPCRYPTLPTSFLMARSRLSCTSSLPASTSPSSCNWRMDR